jgi:hypothetical protein
MFTGSLTSRTAGLPVESLKALDWLNFFLAALLMGFGPLSQSILRKTDGRLQASELS